MCRSLSLTHTKLQLLYSLSQNYRYYIPLTRETVWLLFPFFTNKFLLFKNCLLIQGGSLLPCRSNNTKYFYILL